MNDATTIAIGDELHVNRLGFGAMRLCGPANLGMAGDRENALHVLRRAVELGVNFIDTADAYGPHVNEEQIAQALYPYPTIWSSRRRADPRAAARDDWGRDGRPSHLQAQACEGSLRRLRLEWIDLYQLHAVDPTVPFEDQVGALRDAARRREDPLRRPFQRDAEPSCRRRKCIVEIASVQNSYNVGDRGSESIVEYCEQNGIVFIPYFPLDGGDLHAIEGLKPIAAARRRDDLAGWAGLVAASLAGDGADSRHVVARASRRERCRRRAEVERSRDSGARSPRFEF